MDLNMTDEKLDRYHKKHKDQEISEPDIVKAEKSPEFKEETNYAANPLSNLGIGMMNTPLNRAALRSQVYNAIKKSHSTLNINPGDIEIKTDLTDPTKINVEVLLQVPNPIEYRVYNIEYDFGGYDYDYPNPDDDDE